MLAHICRYHTKFLVLWQKKGFISNNTLNSICTMKRHLALQCRFFVREVHVLCPPPRKTLRQHAKNLWTKQEDEIVDKQIAKQQKEFELNKIRNKETFLAIIEAFKTQGSKRLMLVEFVTAAVRSMPEYHVERDLECYKKLMDVFPKGKMVPSTTFAADNHHFPRHQDCIIELLTSMEENAVCPDKEMQKLLFSIFGPYTHASRKLGRLIYWMPKFKNLSPFPLPDPLPNDILELATLAIKRIGSVDLQAEVCVFRTDDLEDSLDKTWIVSSQSPKQRELLVEHDKKKAIYVEGPFIVWLRKVSISYFILRADGKIYPEPDDDQDDVRNLVRNVLNPLEKKGVMKRPSVHEQEEGVIMALCATGTSSRDTVLSWIRLLREQNPVLDALSVLFTLRAPSKDLVTVNDKRGLDENVVEQQPQTAA